MQRAERVPLSSMHSREHFIPAMPQLRIALLVEFSVSLGFSDVEQERREREELDKLLEQNRLRVEEARRREALEQQEKELERYQELELLQRQKEEAMRRKKLEEEAERANQMKLLGKNRARPKLSFAIGLK
ncbi:hypothetical protein KSP40_PGU013567 [Platanthera guangdongensis]|uniref:Uncharacterized protein n=1 Tax=Platanthera guangdongensis TaxID=2320717 RepID=A0ABR2MSR9_9ASPA